MENTPSNILSTPMGASTPRVNLNMESGTLTPLRQRVPDFQLEMPSEEVERAEHSRVSNIRRSIQNLPSARRSVLNDSSQFYSDEVIKSHIQVCTKLYNENKINAKNVWQLKIIDCLYQLVRRDHPDILQIAANTLDIAGKVFACRVDSLYADVLQKRAEWSKLYADKDKDSDPEDSADPNAPEENPRQKRKQKKKRIQGGPKKTVVDVATLKLAKLPKLESAAFAVPVDRALSTTKNLFTNVVPMDTAGSKFLFLSEKKAWDWQPGSDETVNAQNGKKKMDNIKPLNKFTLCAPFHDFRLDKWDPDNEDKELNKEYSHLLNPLVNDVSRDENGIPIYELDGSIHDVFQEATNVPDVASDDEAPEIEKDLEFITSLEHHDEIPLRVGRFEKLWAGPSHWKLKFIKNRSEIYTGRDEKIKQPAKKRKVREFEPFRGDFPIEDPIDLEKFKNVRFPHRKVVTNVSKITLPPHSLDVQEQIEEFNKLLSAPIVFKPKKETNVPEVELDGYKYDNPNDSMYCPDGQGGFDNDVDDHDGFENNMEEIGFAAAHAGPSDGGACVGFTGDNLVDAPVMVPQTYLNYAKRPKRMDMKKLKLIEWLILTETDEYNAEVKVVPTTFSNMYLNLSNRLPEDMKNQLSAHIAFVALLHLANEHVLKLDEIPDKNDFNIRQT